MMEKKLFDELLASITEAGEILRGEKEPARRTKYEGELDPSFESPDARKIRESLHLSRKEFALVLNVSERTVEGWEQGRRNPSGPALTLLRVAAKHPESILDTMRPFFSSS